MKKEKDNNSTLSDGHSFEELIDKVKTRINIDIDEKLDATSIDMEAIDKACKEFNFQGIYTNINVKYKGELISKDGSKDMEFGGGYEGELTEEEFTEERDAHIGDILSYAIVFFSRQISKEPQDFLTLISMAIRQIIVTTSLFINRTEVDRELLMKEIVSLLKNNLFKNQFKKEDTTDSYYVDPLLDLLKQGKPN